MKIGIDAFLLSVKNKTGVENIAFQVVKNIGEIDRENQYYLYTRSNINDIDFPENFYYRYISVPFSYYNIGLPLALIKDKPEKYLGFGLLPYFRPKKSVSFIYDLAFKYFPETYSGSELVFQNNLLRNILKKAMRVVVPTNSTKNDIIKYFPKFEEKIRVVPLAFNSDIYYKIQNPRDVLGIGSPYILSIGRLEKRKNLLNLTKAFLKFKEKFKTSHKLVLVGKKGYGYNELEAFIHKHEILKNSVIIPGYIKDEDISHLYAKADLFAYPSLYEGFGLPIIEAMACGTPVLTSKVAATSEVAGNAAYLVEPNDYNEIYEGLNQIINNNSLRQSLIRKSEERIKEFSWRKTAEKVLQILQEM